MKKRQQLKHFTDRITDTNINALCLNYITFMKQLIKIIRPFKNLILQDNSQDFDGNLLTTTS